MSDIVAERENMRRDIERILEEREKTSAEKEPTVEEVSTEMSEKVDKVEGNSTGIVIESGDNEAVEIQGGEDEEREMEMEANQEQRRQKGKGRARDPWEKNMAKLGEDSRRVRRAARYALMRGIQKELNDIQHMFDEERKMIKELETIVYDLVPRTRSAWDYTGYWELDSEDEEEVRK